MGSGGMLCAATNDDCPFTKQINKKVSFSTSKRWGQRRIPERSLKKMEGVDIGENGVVLSKRVMVVVDHSSAAKQAMMWALTHVVNTGDLLTLLQVISPQKAYRKPMFADFSPLLANSLASLCKACRPEVEVEALVLEGSKLTTVLSQVKKLEAAVLILGQKKTCALNCLIPSNSEEFVESCIKNAECLTMAVRKQSGGLGGYLISTRWQKNFWLLA